MKEISAFQTSDNQIFRDKSEAEKHEVFLSSKEVIEAFLNSVENAYTSIPQRAIARNSIINWELWKTKNAISWEILGGKNAK